MLGQLPSFMKHKADQTPKTQLQAQFAEDFLHSLAEVVLHDEDTLDASDKCLLKGQTRHGNQDMKG